jgi:hypothetical protein
MLALARALLGLIRPLHECVPFPRSTFAFRVHHTRTAGVSPACVHEFGGPSRLVANSTGGAEAGQTSERRDPVGLAIPPATVSARSWPFTPPLRASAAQASSWRPSHAPDAWVGCFVADTRAPGMTRRAGEAVARWTRGGRGRPIGPD